MGIRPDNGETDQPYGRVDWSLDYSECPEDYVIGRGQFGVLKYKPYKSEMLQFWQYADEAAAREAAPEIYGRFRKYVQEGSLPGADMAKKFLHMGFTRAMRYAKYPGGKKYDDDGNERTAHGPDTTGQWADADKRAAACVYKEYWDRARNTNEYQKLKELHRSGELYDNMTLDAFQKY